MRPCSQGDPSLDSYSSTKADEGVPTGSVYEQFRCH